MPRCENQPTSNADPLTSAGAECSAAQVYSWSLDLTLRPPAPARPRSRHHPPRRQALQPPRFPLPPRPQARRLRPLPRRTPRRPRHRRPRSVHCVSRPNERHRYASLLRAGGVRPRRGARRRRLLRLGRHLQRRPGHLAASDRPEAPRPRRPAGAAGGGRSAAALARAGGAAGADVGARTRGAAVGGRVRGGGAGHAGGRRVRGGGVGGRGRRRGGLPDAVTAAGPSPPGQLHREQPGLRRRLGRSDSDSHVLPRRAAS